MKTFLTLLLCSACITGVAQIRHSPYRFDAAISFNPVVLAASDQMAMAGAEWRFKKRWTVLLDAGYIFSSYYVPNNAVKGTSGFALRPGVKLYSKNTSKEYFAFQIFFKRVDYKLEDWLGKARVNGTPAYEQFQTFTYRKKALSFAVTAGELFRLSDVVLLDLYVGLGVLIKRQRPTEKDATYPNNENGGNFNRFREKAVLPALPLGVKLLIAIH